MKLCYADPQLKVSKEEFERPDLSIKVDCYSAQKQKILRPFKIQMNSNFKKRLRSYFQIYAIAAIVETIKITLLSGLDKYY
jgi:hypothetical protein